MPEDRIDEIERLLIRENLTKKLKVANLSDNTALAKIFMEAKTSGAFKAIPTEEDGTLMVLSGDLILQKISANLPEGYAGNKPETIYHLIPRDKAVEILEKAQALTQDQLNNINASLVLLL